MTNEDDLQSLIAVAKERLDTYELRCSKIGQFLGRTGGALSYLASIRPANPYAGYSSIGPLARRTCAEIEKQFGRDSLADFHRWSIAYFLSNLDPIGIQKRFPEDIVALFVVRFRRILAGLNSQRSEFFSFTNDLFVKDLSLCRLKLIPCGAEYVDDGTGIARRTVIQGGLLDIPRRLKFFLVECGGFKGWYESHWDRRLIRDFTEGGYDECYRRIGALLDRNPEMKGTFGVSWWYDPALDEFGPELSFLRRTPMRYGAKLIRVGVSAEVVEDALKVSPKRRSAFETGDYVPTNYMLVWPRKALSGFLESLHD